VTDAERPGEAPCGPVEPLHPLPAVLSPSGAGLLLLCWLQPTDRALAGWCPADGWRYAPGSGGSHPYAEDLFVQWLSSTYGPQLETRSTERQDMAAVARDGHCQVSRRSEAARTDPHSADL
jgi:hypothetical protein